jgi:hypothetical protein
MHLPYFKKNIVSLFRILFNNFIYSVMKKVLFTALVAFVFCATGSVSAEDAKKEGCSKATTEKVEGKSCCKDKKDADKKSACCKEKKDADKKGACCKEKKSACCKEKAGDKK